jgi:hypothetical protein
MPDNRNPIANPCVLKIAILPTAHLTSEVGKDTCILKPYVLMNTKAEGTPRKLATATQPQFR